MAGHIVLQQEVEAMSGAGGGVIAYDFDVLDAFMFILRSICIVLTRVPGNMYV